MGSCDVDFTSRVLSRIVASLRCFCRLRWCSSPVYLGMHTTPVSLRLRQSPPAASTPAPGPHTSRSTGLLSQAGLRTSAYPDCSGTFSVTGLAVLGRELLNRPFQPRGVLDIV